MNSIDDRIDQFRNMAVEDPENDMAHFSLGNAYLTAGRYAEAVSSLQRCIELNPGMSKAYQLAGEALIESGNEESAAQVLTTGYEAAARRGDVMPRDAMAELLARIGREPPEVTADEAAPSEQPEPGGDFRCQRTGRPGTQLPEPPMRGPLGKWIYDNKLSLERGEFLGEGRFKGSERGVNDLPNHLLNVFLPQASLISSTNKIDGVGIPKKNHSKRSLFGICNSTTVAKDRIKARG